MQKRAKPKLSEVFDAATVEQAKDALHSILRDPDPKVQSARTRLIELTCHYAYGKPVSAFTKAEVAAALRGHDGAFYAKLSQGEVVAVLRRRIEAMRLFEEKIGDMAAEEWAKMRKELAG